MYRLEWELTDVLTEHGIVPSSVVEIDSVTQSCCRDHSRSGQSDLERVERSRRCARHCCTWVALGSDGRWEELNQNKLIRLKEVEPLLTFFHTLTVLLLFGYLE